MNAGNLITDNIRKRFMRGAQAALILLMIVLTAGMMLQIRSLQGNARVVNYAGILRGATQRLVKLEIAGVPSNDLSVELDDIFSGLLHGGGKYSLTRMDDADYQSKLSLQYDYWKQLKDEIHRVRQNGYQNSQIMPMRETYFQLADDTVAAAEVYSQQCVNRLRMLEIVVSIDMVLILFSLISQSINEVRLRRSNRELRHKAYIDLHTALPNKSRCEELLLDRTPVTAQTTLAVFDLNGLKQVNDHLGHLAGDALIANFASILRTSIPEQYFVGRYGGDEFLAILPGVGREQMEQYLERLRSTTAHYNSTGKQLHIEFACGYSVSTDFKECNLKILFEKADRRMYEQKNEMKNKLSKKLTFSRQTVF